MAECRTCHGTKRITCPVCKGHTTAFDYSYHEEGTPGEDMVHAMERATQNSQDMSDECDNCGPDRKIACPACKGTGVAT